ncbi:hypothetical protein [Akkermansia muciniphila]|uniref:hypothetical protein n=2 Tax=Akkermansia muciniphila TaxID=239935 RepID=UPI00319E1529
MNIVRIFFILLYFFLTEEGVSREGTLSYFSLPTVPGMTRADFYCYQGATSPQAILILVPGFNGNGKTLVAEAKWQNYAVKNKLLLIGISFASKIEDIQNGKGYYYVEKGSGEILLAFLRRLSSKKRPLYMYGFSGGAHFVSRFVEWAPSEVNGWCAYAAGWWTSPCKRGNAPPGIVACGDNDYRLGSSFCYFKEGRKIGRRWLWINITDVGHSPCLALDDFVRDYFEVLIKEYSIQHISVWIDIETGEKVCKKFLKKVPSLTGFLPSETLIPKWKNLNKSK